MRLAVYGACSHCFQPAASAQSIRIEQLRDANDESDLLRLRFVLSGERRGYPSLTTVILCHKTLKLANYDLRPLSHAPPDPKKASDKAAAASSAASSPSGAGSSIGARFKLRLKRIGSRHSGTAPDLNAAPADADQPPAVNGAADAGPDGDRDGKRALISCVLVSMFVCLFVCLFVLFCFLFLTSVHFVTVIGLINIDAEQAVQEGNVRMQTQTIAKKSGWKRRFLVLQQTRLLVFNSEKDWTRRSQPLEAISLLLCTVVHSKFSERQQIELTLVSAAWLILRHLKLVCEYS